MFLVTRQKEGICGGTFCLLLLDIYIINFFVGIWADVHMPICIYTSAQYSSTPITSISLKPLDHAVSLFTYILLRLPLPGFSGVYFPHSSAYSSLLCFCGWDGVDSTWCFGYCWAVIAWCQGFLSNPRGWARGWEGIEHIWLTLTTGTFPTFPWSCAQQRKLRERKRKWGCYHFGFPSTCTQYVLRSCFPGNGWTSAYWWNIVNKFIFFLCFHV